MASTLLLCSKLISRPMVCRSMCQAMPIHASNLPAKRRRQVRDSVVACEFVKGEASTDIVYFRLLVFGSDPPELGSCNGFINEMALEPEDPKMAHPSTARPFLAQMITRGVIPSLSTFSTLVRAYCLDLQLPYQHVLDVVFTQMKAMEVEPNDFFYRSLMKAVCSRVGPQSAYELLKTLRSSLEIQMPLLGYNPIVEHFCKKEMMQEAAMVLIDMKQHQVFPDGYIYVRLLKKQNRSSDEGCSEIVGIGRQMLVESIKMGVVSPTALYKSISRIGEK